MIEDKEAQFIREQFRKYYVRHSKSIKTPSSIANREFGFFPLNKEKMIRHTGFQKIEQLIEFIINFVPADIYHSAAYYKKPDEDKMLSKDWFGTDLIFDIDCDHIETSCKNKHTIWICTNCANAKLEKITICPNCNSEKMEEDPWICDTCLDAAKQETLKLVSILEEDFGFSEKELDIAFSGHRGYHLHIERKNLQKIGASERKEIVDYITGSGLNINIYSSLGKEKKIFELNIARSGWVGRITKNLYALSLKKSENLRQDGLDSRIINRIEKKREIITENLASGISWDEMINLIGEKTWQKIVANVIAKASVHIDTVVTTDVHRLIRLPNTLHGKTAFRTVPLSMTKLYDFNPLEDAIVFEGEPVQVNVKAAMPIKIGGQLYGPYRNETVKLPMAVALFFICRGNAFLNLENDHFLNVTHGE